MTLVLLSIILRHVGQCRRNGHFQVFSASSGWRWVVITKLPYFEHRIETSLTILCVWILISFIRETRLFPGSLWQAWSTCWQSTTVHGFDPVGVIRGLSSNESYGPLLRASFWRERLIYTLPLFFVLFCSWPCWTYMKTGLKRRRIMQRKHWRCQGGTTRPTIAFCFLKWSTYGQLLLAEKETMARPRNCSMILWR